MAAATGKTGESRRWNTRVAQADLLKGLAAVSVVILHSVSKSALLDSWSVFHIWQAVPVFVLLMGFTSRLSHERKQNAPPGSGRWIQSRIRRLLIPFLVPWTASFALALFSPERPYFGWQTLLFRLPGPGRGAYFVLIALSFTLIAPLLMSLYSRSRAGVIAAAFAAEIAFELLAPLTRSFSDPYLYSATALRYLPLFVLGMWLADEDGPVQRPTTRPWVLAYAAGSALYLIAWNAGLITLPFLNPGWTMQNAASFGWPLLVVAGGLFYLPRQANGPVLLPLSQIGAASYHVFLTQMVLVVVAPTASPLRAGLNVVLSCAIGWVWFKTEARMNRKSTPTGS